MAWGLALSLVAAAVLMHAAAHVDTLQWFALTIYVVTMVAVYACLHPPRTFLRSLACGTFSACSIKVASTCLSPARSRPSPPPFCERAPGGCCSQPCGRFPLPDFSARLSSITASIILPQPSRLSSVGCRSSAAPRCWVLVPVEVRWLVLAGGVCYTLGILFLITDHRHRNLHAVWHLWVIAGTACHFWAILHYTLPAG